MGIPILLVRDHVLRFPKPETRNHVYSGTLPSACGSAGAAMNTEVSGLKKGYQYYFGGSLL